MPTLACLRHSRQGPCPCGGWKNPAGTGKLRRSSADAEIARRTWTPRLYCRQAVRLHVCRLWHAGSHDTVWFLGYQHAIADTRGVLQLGGNHLCVQPHVCCAISASAELLLNFPAASFCCTMSSQSTNVTDGQTDRQTDVMLVACRSKTDFSVACVRATDGLVSPTLVLRTTARTDYSEICCEQLLGTVLV